MTAQELINEIFYAYKGKISTRIPAWGSDKANLYLAIANRKQREWCTDPKNKWNSLFADDVIDQVDATTPTATYNLPATYFLSSDFARVVKTDDSIVEYPIVTVPRRNDNEQSLYISGSNPKKITFSQTIDTGLDGGDLYVPGYYLLDNLTESTDPVLVDDPMWLVYITASELARNDAAKDDQYVNLVNQANDRYTKMIEANRDVGYGQPLSVTNMMPIIGSTEDWSD